MDCTAGSAASAVNGATPFVRPAWRTQPHTPRSHCAEARVSLDGRHVSRLRRPTSDYCARQFEAAGKPGAAPPPEGSPVCGINGSNNALTAGSFPLSAFASFLAGQARRIVVDRTGLNGVWDFDLKWSPPDTPNADPDHPSIFTALEEQLGLRLDAATGPVEVLVIDRIEALIPD